MSPTDIATMGTAIGTLLYTIYRNERSASAKSVKDAERWRTDTDLRLTELDIKMSVFWKDVGFNAAKALHSPGHPELDELIEKYQGEVLTWDELRKLIEMLAKITNDMEGPKAERLAAGQLLNSITHYYEPLVLKVPSNPHSAGSVLLPMVAFL